MGAAAAGIVLAGVKIQVQVQVQVDSGNGREGRCPWTWHLDVEVHEILFWPFLYLDLSLGLCRVCHGRGRRGSRMTVVGACHGHGHERGRGGMNLAEEDLGREGVFLFRQALVLPMRVAVGRDGRLVKATSAWNILELEVQWSL